MPSKDEMSRAYIANVKAKIAELEALLASPELVMAEIRSETQALKKSFNNPRKTVIHDAELADQTDESFIPHEDSIITLSQKGYGEPSISRGWATFWPLLTTFDHYS